MMERELLKGNTPTMILAVLRDGALHGYAVAREIERRSGGVLQFKEGTLYPALHALERDGWVSSKWETQGNGPARKVYALTQNGHKELTRRTRAWETFTAAVGNVIGGKANESAA